MEARALAGVIVDKSGNVYGSCRDFSNTSEKNVFRFGKTYKKVTLSGCRQDFSFFTG
jgi:hypothetical protein